MRRLRIAQLRRTSITITRPRLSVTVRVVSVSLVESWVAPDIENLIEKSDVSFRQHAEGVGFDEAVLSLVEIDWTKDLTRLSESTKQIHKF